MIGTMPRYVRPEMESPLEAAIEAFGNRIRVQILGALREHGPATRGEVAAAIGAGHSNTVFHHLRGLEQLGLIEADPPAGGRVSGQRVRYLLIEDKVDALYTVLGQALRAEESE